MCRVRPVRRSLSEMETSAVRQSYAFLRESVCVCVCVSGARARPRGPARVIVSRLPVSSLVRPRHSRQLIYRIVYLRQSRGIFGGIATRPLSLRSHSRDGSNR